MQVSLLAPRNLGTVYKVPNQAGSLSGQQHLFQIAGSRLLTPYIQVVPQLLTLCFLICLLSCQLISPDTDIRSPKPEYTAFRHIRHVVIQIYYLDAALSPNSLEQFIYRSIWSPIQRKLKSRLAYLSYRASLHAVKLFFGILTDLRQPDRYKNFIVTLYS